MFKPIIMPRSLGALPSCSSKILFFLFNTEKSLLTQILPNRTSEKGQQSCESRRDSSKGYSLLAAEVVIGTQQTLMNIGEQENQKKLSRDKRDWESREKEREIVFLHIRLSKITLIQFVSSNIFI